MAHATMSTEVATILRSFWEWRLRESPEFATQIGVHTYDSNLDGHSLEAYARRQVYLYQVRLVSTSYDGLSSFKEVATLHSECYVENLVRESLFVSAALPVQAKNLTKDWSVSDWYNYGINCGTGSWFGTPKGRPSALSFAEAFISKHQ